MLNKMNPLKITFFFAAVFGLLAFSPKSTRAQDFLSHVASAVSQQNYSYTVFNDEPANSTNYGKFFTLYLPVPTPFTVTGTPDGWAYSTDNSAVVSWYNTDPTLPYSHDIAPGSFLSGFSITSTTPTSAQPITFEVDAWDHATDSPGPAVVGTTLGPQPIPEASTMTSFGLGLALLIVIALAARFRAKRGPGVS